MKHNFYKYVDAYEIQLGENVHNSYNGYGKLIIDRDDGLIDEYIGFFKNGEIKEGKYRRRNSIMLNEVNKRIDDFRSMLSSRNDEGYTIRKKYSGDKQGQNGGIDIEPMNKLFELIDIQYEGLFFEFEPNDNMGKLTLKFLGWENKVVYNHYYTKGRKNSGYYDKQVPSIKTLDFCGNISFSKIKKGAVRDYDAMYKAIELVQFKAVDLNESLTFKELKEEPIIEKFLCKFGVDY